MTDDLYLREVVEDDLPLFFEFQLDPDANYMAAFIALKHIGSTCCQR